MVDLSTQLFYVDSVGNVRVADASGLSADIREIYSIQVKAYDSVFPNMKTTASVTIYVDRNPSSPRFTLNNYVFNINDR